MQILSEPPLYKLLFPFPGVALFRYQFEISGEDNLSSAQKLRIVSKYSQARAAAAESCGGGDLVRDLGLVIEAVVSSLSVRFRRSSDHLVDIGSVASSMCFIRGFCDDEAGSDATGPPVVLTSNELDV